MNRRDSTSSRNTFMRKNLQTLAVPALITAGLFTGCSSPRVVERTDPNRPSSVQVAEGYDTVGRKWEENKPAPAPAPAPAPIVAATAPAPAPATADANWKWGPATPSESVGAPPPAEVLTRKDSVVLNYTGTITDIDYDDRELTLKDDSDGEVQTFRVDKDVTRFSEAKVGDKVSMDYSLGLTSEIRKPTPEEEKNPYQVTETESRAGAGSDPSARSTRTVRAVVTIDAMDRTAKTVTVKGPRGKRVVMQVKDPSRFQQVHIGDSVLMTFTESAALSLEPAK